MLKEKNKKTAFVFLSIIFIALFFRIGGLDKMLLGDEIKWVSRSTKFFNGLITGNLEETFSTAHPGVTLMWLSGGSFWISSKISGNEEIFQKIAKTDHINPNFPAEYMNKLPDILKIMRLPIAILSAFLIGVAFLFLSKIIGVKKGLLASLIVALDPFIIANSKIIHLDALLTIFMLLSVLSLIIYLKGGSKKFIWFCGIFTGLSLLTKLPSFFLLPFIGIVLSIYYIKKEKFVPKAVFSTFKKLFFITAIATLVFIILWPAMWVQPIKSLYRDDSIHSVFSNIPYEIETPHKSNFFLGQQTEKVGFLFYPVTILFKTTPLSLIFFILAIIFLFIKKYLRLNLVIFFLFIVLFGIMMSVGAKKGDRYLLPVYPFIDILAAWTLFNFLKIIPKIKKVSFWAAAAIIAVFGIYITTYNPYFISYFNPIGGGGETAKKSYVIGLGEGLDLAAEYLNQKEGSENLKVASWYSSSFAPFFKGKTFSEREVKNQDIDYIILYINGVQRELPEGTYEDYFLKKEPEKIIKIKGLEYAWIYPK